MGDDPDIIRHLPVFRRAASRVAAAHILRHHKETVFLWKRRIHIHRVILLVPGQQGLIIPDRKERGRKQDGAGSLVHASGKEPGGIHAEEAHQEGAVLPVFLIDLVMAVQLFIDI